MPVMQNFDRPPIVGTVAQIIGEHLQMTDDETEAFASVKVTVLETFEIEGHRPGLNEWGAMVRIATGDASGGMREVRSCDLYMVMQ